jgi:hypothetical protein
LITHLLNKKVASNYGFIPMLTNPRSDGEGNKEPKYIKGKSCDLYCFIINRRETKDLKHWEKWLKPFVKSYKTKRPVNKVFFDDSNRDCYWKQYEDISKLANALIFIDPDTGLETGTPSYQKRMGREKYILNGEIKGLVQALDSTSVLMIYQHLQRNRHKHEDSVQKKLHQANKASGSSLVLAYREDDLAFIFITKSNKIFEKMREGLDSYYKISGHAYKSMHYFHKQ